MFQQKSASGQFSMAGISNVRTETLLKGAVVLILLFDLVYFIIGFNNGLMEEHAFRQAQTALSDLWPRPRTYDEEANTMPHPSTNKLPSFTPVT